MNLQLSLKKKWFDMTTAEIKTEDYRLITPYWAKRFLLCHGDFLQKEFNKIQLESLCEELNNIETRYRDLALEVIYHKLNEYILSFKQFTKNTMTLGRTKPTDSERIIRFEHAGIEIRTGNSEWGSEPNRLYFVIKHGKRL